MNASIPLAIGGIALGSAAGFGAYKTLQSPIEGHYERRREGDYTTKDGTKLDSPVVKDEAGRGYANVIPMVIPGMAGVGALGFAANTALTSAGTGGGKAIALGGAMLGGALLGLAGSAAVSLGRGEETTDARHGIGIAGHVDGMISSYDANGDGALGVTDRNEFLQPIPPHRAGQPSPGYRSIEQVLTKADGDGDGVASRDELTKLFSSYDANGDGKLSHTKAEYERVEADGLGKQYA